jgi:hypothetical protein
MQDRQEIGFKSVQDIEFRGYQGITGVPGLTTGV